MLGMPEEGSEAAVNAENTRAMATSLQALKKNCKTNIGRIAYNTVLAAAAGAGEHVCSPDDPCDPARRCPPAAPEGAVTMAQRAESLGVRTKTFRDGHWRMHLTDHSIHPAQAVEEGRYCWAARKARSDLACWSWLAGSGTRTPSRVHQEIQVLLYCCSHVSN